MNPLAQKIEALLFVAGEAISFKELAAILEVTPEEVASGITEVIYSLKDHGITVTQTDTHVQLVTSGSVSDFLARYLQEEPTELSKAVAEVLAIVAYRGPITRAEIDAIRGVDSRRSLSQLVVRGMVARIKKATQTITYDITPDFLQHIGLTSREQLPKFEDLAHHERLKALLEQEQKV